MAVLSFFPRFFLKKLKASAHRAEPRHSVAHVEVYQTNKTTVATQLQLRNGVRLHEAEIRGWCPFSHYPY